MEVQWILVSHGLLTLLVLISFLCGQWPIFQGTFIQRFHRFLTYGAYNYFVRFVVALFGPKGGNAISAVEYYLCDRPNPILQVIYLSIIGGTYYLITNSCFGYMYGYHLSEIHRYTSRLAVCVGVLLFLLTSFSDPGIVKDENVCQYLSVYSYDNIIYSEKDCSTCKIPKPARSKHCSICDRCVARFDHHCAWMNNCIGEKNSRYFLAFLLWHFALCVYGVVVIALVLFGRLNESKIIYILTEYYGIENSFRSLSPHVVQWLLWSYNSEILLMVFLGIVALLLAGFWGYHVRLVLSNTTTNETFKWDEYVLWRRKLNEAKASAAALKACINGMGMDIEEEEEKATADGGKWRRFFFCGNNNDAGIIRTNVYNKGMFHNIGEIVYPPSTRRSFCRIKSKSA